MLIVTTPNADRDLTTVAVVKAELGDVEIDDAQIAAFITQASDIIAAHCRRTFQIETVAETFIRQTRCDDLMLSRYPVTEIVSVDTNGTSVDPEDYHLEPTTGFLFNTDAGWWSGRVVVTYKAGYELPDAAPAGVQRACIDMVMQMISGVTSEQPSNIRAETVEGIGSKEFFNTSTFATLSPDVEALLAPHCKPNH